MSDLLEEILQDTPFQMRETGDVDTYRKALKEILWIGEQHTDSATSRRIADFRKAIKVAREGLYGPDKKEPS